MIMVMAAPRAVGGPSWPATYDDEASDAAAVVSCLDRQQRAYAFGYVLLLLQRTGDAGDDLESGRKRLRGRRRVALSSPLTKTAFAHGRA